MKRKNSGRHSRSSNIHLGFQIAPMVGIIFVILLFFVIAVGNIPKEPSFAMRLPSCCDDRWFLATPDEVEVRVNKDGQVYLNDDMLDGPEAERLPELAAVATVLRRAAGADGWGIQVIVKTDPETKYQRLMDVMDIFAHEGIPNLTFMAGLE